MANEFIDISSLESVLKICLLTALSFLNRNILLR